MPVAASQRHTVVRPRSRQLRTRPSLQHPNLRVSRAFTLIELSLVVGILGIIAAIAIPRYGSASATFRSRSAAIRVATDLNHASSLAKARSISVAVIFSSDGTSYKTVLDPSAAATIKSNFSLSDQPYFATINPASLPVGRIITFDGFGQPDVQPTIEVLASQRPTSLSVDANGRVTVNTP